MTSVAPIKKDFHSQVRNLYILFSTVEEKLVEYITTPHIQVGLSNYLYSLKYTALRECININNAKHVRLGEIVEILTLLIRCQ